MPAPRAVPPRAAAVPWGFGLAMAASLVLLALRARLPLPYRDDWDWCRWLLSPVTLTSYFTPHNEHLIPLARLLLQLQPASCWQRPSASSCICGSSWGLRRPPVAPWWLGRRRGS